MDDDEKRFHAKLKEEEEEEEEEEEVRSISKKRYSPIQGSDDWDYIRILHFGALQLLKTNIPNLFENEELQNEDECHQSEMSHVNNDSESEKHSQSRLGSRLPSGPSFLWIVVAHRNDFRLWLILGCWWRRLRCLWRWRRGWRRSLTITCGCRCTHRSSFGAN